MNDEAYKRGCREVDAYNAIAAAKAGQDISVITDKMLGGRYHQGVVDASASASRQKSEEKKTKKKKK